MSELLEQRIRDLEAEVKSLRGRKKPTTFMIEGEWSGYRSSQRRVVHREFTKSRKYAAQIEALSCIVYTDGTSLELRVSLVAGKKPPEIKSYSELIHKCLARGVNSVAALYAKEDATAARPSE